MEIVLVEAMAVFKDVMTTMLMMTVGTFIISLGSSSSSSSSSSIEDAAAVPRIRYHDERNRNFLVCM